MANVARAPSEMLANLVIQMMPHPVAAKRFVEPLVQQLQASGWHAELWIEDIHGLKDFADSIEVTKCVKRFSLRGNPVALLLGTIDIWRTLKSRNPRVIAAHQTRDAFLPLLAAYVSRVPVRIYHNHGIPYLGYRGPVRLMLKVLEWANCHLATHVLTVSKGMQLALVKDGLVKKSKCTVPGYGSACGLDFSVFSMGHFSDGKIGAKKDLGLEADAFVAIYVGRPEKRKGAPRLLSVWAAGMSSTDILLLAGITSEQASTLCCDIEGNVKALGYVHDLRPFYAAADVVVLPSEHEGFGYALLEGAAMECCLVASRIPGPDALVKQGETGYLVEVGNNNELTNVLKYLKENREHCRQIGIEARKFAANHFGRASVLNAYTQLLSEFQ